MLANLLRKASSSSQTHIKSQFSCSIDQQILTNGSMNQAENYGTYNNKAHPKSNAFDHMYDDSKFKLFGTNELPNQNDQIDLATKAIHSSSSSLSLSKRVSSSTSLSAVNSAEGEPDGFGVFIMEETTKNIGRCSYKIPMEYVIGKGTSLQNVRPNELKEYIFGSPVRLITVNESTKIRYLPTSGLIMVVRTFYYTSDDNRLAICLCVPKKYLTMICEMWKQVLYWLNFSQNILIALITSRNNSKIAWNNTTSEAYYSDTLLPSGLHNHYPADTGKIITCLKVVLMSNLDSIFTTPRIFLYPNSSKKFIESWFSGVFNWLEIRDGNKVGFLTVLIAKIIYDFKSLLLKSDTSNIVILSGNQVVANKLVFILSSLLEPKYRGRIKFDFKQEDDDTEKFLSQNGNNKENNTSINDSSLFGSDLETIAPSEGSIRHVSINHYSVCSNSSLNEIHSTSQGWEIPNKRNTSPVTCVSSDGYLGDVVQPSSFKSGSSSLHQLFTTLSSQPHSYGSWLNKKPSLSQYAQQTPSTNSSSGSADRTSGVLYRSVSSTSLHGPQVRTMSNFNFNFLVSGGFSTPQPSPSISEYDEFPWAGTPSPISIIGNSDNNGISNQNKYFNEQKMNIERIKYPITNTKISRDYQRLSQDGMIEEAFEKLTKDNIWNDKFYSITTSNENHAAVLEVPLSDENLSFMQDTISTELLPKFTTFQPEYTPLFQFQACPLNPDSENKIAKAMKNSLLTDPEAHTLIINPGNREIKELFMVKRNLHDGMHFVSSSNNAAIFTQERVILHTKKIYSNGRIVNPTLKVVDFNYTSPVPLADGTAVIEAILREAGELVLQPGLPNSSLPQSEVADKLQALFWRLLTINQT